MVHLIIEIIFLLCSWIASIINNLFDMLKRLCLVLCLVVLAVTADKEEWKKRSIYQLLTDRFARNDGGTN